MEYIKLLRPKDWAKNGFLFIPLFFAGEIMDVDGITGGFNFQNAWTSGWIAATHIAGNAGTQGFGKSLPEL